MTTKKCIAAKTSLTMNLKYHSDFSSFYDTNGHIYPEPKESIPELETKLKEACEKLKSLPNTSREYSDKDDMSFNYGMARFNLCSFIENLEWKIDLKLIYANSN